MKRVGVNRKMLAFKKEALIEKEVYRKTRVTGRIESTRPRLRQPVCRETIKAKEGEVLVEDISGLVVGDTVKIKHLNRYGTVTEISNKQIKALVNGLLMMFEPGQVVKVLKSVDR